MSDPRIMSRVMLHAEVERLRRELELRSAASIDPEEHLRTQLSLHQAELEAQNLELRQTQSELEVQLLRYAALYQGAPVAFCTFDAHGKILELNEAAALLWGRRADALVGKPLASLVSEGDLSRTWEHFRRCAEGAGRVSTEMTLMGPRAVHVQLVSLPGPRMEGATAFHTALLDVTAERAAQQRLRALIDLDEALSAAVDVREALEAACACLAPALGDACVAWLGGVDGPRLAVAAADSYARGQHLNDALRQDGVPPELQALQGAVRPGEVLLGATPELGAWLFGPGRTASAAVVCALHSRHGVRGWLLLAARAPRRGLEAEDLVMVRQAADRLGQTIHRARLYQKALQDVRVREDFLAIVSHDLVNAAASIKLTAEAMDERTADAEVRQGNARRIRASAEWILEVVRKLLDVAAMESGAIPLDTDGHPVAALLEEARDALSPAVAERRVALEVVPVNGAWVRADADRVLQVFSNLLGNALKYAPEGSVVRLGAKPSGREVHLYVEDHGPGISPEDLPRVFNRFWQARRASRAGVGLGLSIVKAIVEAHGGRAWVHSEVGRGATFWFSLPAFDPPAAVAAPGTGAQTGSKEDEA